MINVLCAGILISHLYTYQFKRQFSKVIVKSSRTCVSSSSVQIEHRITLCAGEGGQAGGAGRYPEEPRVLQLLPPGQRRGGPDLADQEVDCRLVLEKVRSEGS